MSLGVLRVAAVLEQAGHAVEVMDLSGVENFEDAVSSYCQGMNPAQVFGITSTSPQLPAAVKVADRLRSELGRGIRVILGGPHVTLVNAAAKKGVPRACRAFGKLLDSFDVLVAGDGEVAIHQAIKSSWPRLVDADDPKSSMFLTNQMLSDVPFPARHLVDVSSYHYKIDGADATSLIAQLGCLDPNTPVLLSSGIELPISDVKKGDRVVCFDTEKNEITTAPVEATWEREADDLWDLSWRDGTHLRVTVEHPIWTPRGWVSVEKLNEGDLCLRSVREVVQGIEEEGKKEPNPKARLIWDKVTSKVFVGKGRVCNLTIHPIHTYFANGMVVHNCPFGCGFCGGRMSPSLRKIRMRSIESILSEMEHLHKSYGFTGFMFYDDELNVNTKMVPMMDAIAELAEDLGVEFKLRGFVKAELFNEQQAAAMYKAGFRWILTGFESGSPRILKNIQKKATQEENSRAVDIAHSHGIKVKALMSIGHPGESKESVAETKDWLLEVKPEDFDVTIITTYPGTPYYDGAVASGDEWRYEINGDALYATEVDYTKVCDYYKGDPNDGYVSYVRTDFLTAEELVEERKNVESSVRETLGIPFNPSVAAQRYEHSMGQLPNNILKVKA